MTSFNVATDFIPLTTEKGDKFAPTGWRWKNLSELAKLESGHTPSRRHPEWWGGNIPWIALPDIRAADGREIFDTAEQTNELGLANSAARLLPKGTVCMSRTASVGFVTIMGKPMATSQDFVNWVCGPELNPWFLLWLLVGARNYILSLSSGAIHKTVYMPTVERFRVCVPLFPEQDRIIAALSKQLISVDRANRLLDQQRADLEALKPALLRAAFSGQL